MATCSPFLQILEDHEPYDVMNEQGTFNNNSSKHPTHSDTVWLINTIKNLCEEANQGEQFHSILKELQNRGFVDSENNDQRNERDIPKKVPQIKRSGSPFAQVYSTLSTISQNEFGTVLKVQNLIDKQFYALKTMRLCFEEIPAAMREVQNLAVLQSHNLVRYFSSWIDEIPDSQNLYSFYIQTELVEGQSLESFLEANQNCNDDTLRDIILEIAKALQEIHNYGIVHRDFRPSNIMFRTDGSIVVIGFGISSSPKACRNFKKTARPSNEGTKLNVNPQNQHPQIRNAVSLNINPFEQLCIDAADTACSKFTHRKLGSPIYASPQQLNGRKSTPSDDIYSFGIIFYEILAKLNRSADKTKLIRQLRNSALVSETFRNKYPTETELILKMTKHDASSRPTAQEILNSDAFKAWMKNRSTQ